jgi:protocatechuate 3,4-dioxygenase, alpha subunit
MSVPAATAAQTAGPFWHLIDFADGADLTRFGATGGKLFLQGRVFDGDGAPVIDGLIELWQASPEASDIFPGYGRCATDTEGKFRFTTVKPGPLPGRGNTLQAPHFAINILARGIMTRLYTRAYFAGEALNDTDPLLSMIENKARRATLIARPDGKDTWRMDIRLQGEGETVFIEI